MMTPTEAEALVTLLGATASRPALTAEEVSTIVGRHKVRDAAGVQPDELGWVSTYNVNAAVAEVYRIKGARVAGDYNFTADDASFSKGDVLANLLAMETKYLDLAAAGGRDSGGAIVDPGAGTLDVSRGYGRTLDSIAARVIP